ncbi:MAG: DUF4082 domain-containing protein [Nocardioides sp.]
MTAFALMFLVVQVAVAAWIISSPPSAAAARTIALPLATGVTATANGQDGATVTWQAASLPEGVGPVVYQVTALPAGGGEPRSPGGTCTGIVSATSCGDIDVPDGTWVYRVAVRLGSWTGPISDPSSALTFPAAANSVAAENQQPGSPASEWEVSGAGDSTIQGFATDISAASTDTVRFKVDTTAESFRIDVYRLGWYGGDGARKVDTIPATATTPTDQPSCLRNATGIADCGNWSVSATWAVPDDAVSGVYIGRLVRTDTGGASHVPFVVRDDTGGSDLVFQTSDTTWQAYNRYGGASLYWGDGPGTGGGSDGRAYKVSYNRPITTRDYAPEDTVFNAEYPMIRWLERNGYDVSYIAGVDAHRSGAELLEHKAYLSVGHDEYWSSAQRSNVEAARDAGVDLAFFSGNEAFWRTRFEDSIDGTSTPHRTLASYKETHNYPDNPDPAADWTGTWRDPRDPDSVDKPENGLTGTIFTVNSGSSAMTVTPQDGQMRLWRGTSVASSPGADTFGSEVIGYEWDEDLDNGSRPAGQIRLSDTTVTGVEKVVPSSYGSLFAGGGTARHTLTLHRDQQSSALVFGAGTIQWSWGLDAQHDRGSGTPVAAMQQATANLFADMGAQPTTLQDGLNAADASTDITAPTSVVTAPTEGSTVQSGSSVTITGTATDTGGLVGGVEVSTDNGQTWHPAEGRSTWSYTFTAPTPEGGTVKILSRATDDSVNTGPASEPVTVTVAARECTVGAPCSIFPDAAPSTVRDATDGTPLELGVKFRSDQTGQVRAVRFYKPLTDTGSFTGRLYSSTGTLLGSSDPTTLAGSGWQVLPLVSPVQVSPGTTYVASYYSESGQFAITDPGSPGSLVTAAVNPPLRGLAAGADGPNGVFRYGAGGGFPDTAPTNPGPNYWADVLFTNAADTTAPTVASTSPTGGATNIAVTAPVTATFDEPVKASTVTSSTFTLAPTAGGPAVAATVSASGSAATLIPDQPLATNTTYIATLVGGSAGVTDVSDNPLAGDHTWSFTTAASAEVTLFGNVTPGTATDSNDYELGVRFRSSTDGLVTGIRFYKGAQNTGLHTGRLWNATSQQLLGNVTFSDETATGWQTAYFDTPLSIQAGTTYIASYSVPVGFYAAEANYFTAGDHTSGPLTAPQSTSTARNGIYSGTPGSFPTESFNDTNYFVDVTFQTGPDTTSPTVTSRSPAAGATGVATSTTVSSIFSEPVKASTVDDTTFSLTQGGTSVPATVVTDGSTVTLIPVSPLAADTTYTVTLRGGAGGITDVADNPLAEDVTWTFDTLTGTTTAYTVFGASPGGAAAGPDAGQSIELGVKLRVSQGGYVSAIRFHKPYAEGDSFTGRLYTADGTVLGEGTASLPANATGWQEIPLVTPVSLTPDTTYVATYFSPTGRYAYTAGGLVGAPVTNGPITALQSGTDGPNGVYRYGGGFPTEASATPANYWADVVFNTGPLPPDTNAPLITNRVPGPGAAAVSQGTSVAVTFNEPVAPSSVTATNLALIGPGGPVPATRQTSGATVTLTPTGELAPETTYSVTLLGGGDGVTDLAGNPLATGDTWSFTTRAGAAPRSDPNQGPGGPVLAVGGGGFGRYLPELLRGEGLNHFTTGGTSDLTGSGLTPYTMVVLGATGLTSAQVDALTTWVENGGDLVALRPDPQLAGLLGLTGPAGSLSEGYIKVDTSADPGTGIVGETMQFHGTADRYGLASGTQEVATLYSTSSTATANPAVTTRQVGNAGGSAAAFTYDLARSVVLTRQGNPAWVNQNRDGEAGPNRSDDLFFGAMTGDVQPDYVDLSKVAIPQADEQQRLLANLMTEASLDAQPLPRFWYLPGGEEAAIVMTADQHDGGDVSGRFELELDASPPNCSVADWECIRSTSYLYPSYPAAAMTAAQAKGYQDQGFEIALHPNTQCQSWSRTQFAEGLSTQLADLAAKYPGIEPSVTSRNHCIAWTDYTTVPEELAKQGIHLDTNYYHWPPGWVRDVPGLFTGSGFAQRFATNDGQLVDVYQATTQMTDESGQSYPSTAVALLENALGPKGYYGTFVTNIHTDNASSEPIAAGIVAAAEARGVPVISAGQLMTWTDGRNDSSFDDLGWAPGTGVLTFTVDVGAGARRLEAMVPTTTGGELLTLTGPGGPVTPATRVVKGVSYAVFPAQDGVWTATYQVAEPDTTPPSVTSTVPADGATDVSPTAPVRATFSEQVDPVTVTGATFAVEAGGTPVAGTVDYDAGSRTATFTPDAALALDTAHTARLGTGIRDVAGNALTDPVSWNFTTSAASPPPDAPAVSDSSEADFGVGTTDGAAVRPDGDGAVGLASSLDTLAFGDPDLPAGWAARGVPWTTGGTATIGDGALSVDGTAVYGPSGRYAAIEAEATFTAASFQNIGLAADADFNNPWFTFGIGNNPDQVYARSSSGVSVGLGSGLLGSKHIYRVEWSPSEVRWFIDGTLRHTAPITVPNPLVPIVSEYTVDGSALVVDALETSRYAANGTFSSRVFDAGQASRWGVVTPDADAPAGTTLEVQVRTGDTATPDETWSGFITVAGGQAPTTPAGRYLQYRLLMTSTDALVTPVIRSLTIGGT